jgi:hypothetical protein
VTAEFTPSGLASALRRSHRPAVRSPVEQIRSARADMEGCAIYLSSFFGHGARAEELYRLADLFAVMKDRSP